MFRRNSLDECNMCSPVYLRDVCVYTFVCMYIVCMYVIYLNVQNMVPSETYLALQDRYCKVILQIVKKRWQISLRYEITLHEHVT